MNIKLICVCSDLGLQFNGTDLGPKAISKCMKQNNIIEINKENIRKSIDNKDYCKNLKGVNNVNKKLFNEVFKTLQNNEFPIIIGGDHSIAIGSALASLNYHKNLGIIWIDAHTDYNTINTTETGNIHGLPLAVINGHDKNKLSTFLTNKYISHKNTVIVGARSIDKEEINNLKKDGIVFFTTEDIKKYGIKFIMDKAFEIALNNTYGIHISYDLDIIDPNIAPGVSVPEENGISKEQSYEIMNYIKDNKNVIKSLDLVEYNPITDIDNKTLNISLDLLNIFIKN